MRLLDGQLHRVMQLGAAVMGLSWLGLLPTLAVIPASARSGVRLGALLATLVLVLSQWRLQQPARTQTGPADNSGREPHVLRRQLSLLLGSGLLLAALHAGLWGTLAGKSVPSPLNTALSLLASGSGLAVLATLLTMVVALRCCFQTSAEVSAPPLPNPAATQALLSDSQSGAEFRPVSISASAPPAVPAPLTALTAAPSLMTLQGVSAAGLVVAGWLLCAGLVLGSRQSGLSTEGLPQPATLPSLSFGLCLLAAALPMGGLAFVMVRAATQDVATDLRTLADELRSLNLRPTGSSPALTEAITSSGQMNRLYLALDKLRSQCNQHIAAYHQELLRAEEADRRRTEFIGDVGRELRAPVQAILSDAEKLVAELSPETYPEATPTVPVATEPCDPRQREAAVVICKSAEHLQSLLLDIFNSAVLQGGLRLGKRRPVEVATIARELFRLLRPLVSSAQVQLRLSVDPKTPPALADAQAVRRILGNLISNAVKFTERGEIAVAIAPAIHRGEIAPYAVRIQVSDTGPGIAATELNHLFEEYSQGSAPSGSALGIGVGIGLGLFIARKLTELHGGKITVKSELGHGTSFVITLPLASLADIEDVRAAAFPPHQHSRLDAQDSVDAATSSPALRHP